MKILFTTIFTMRSILMIVYHLKSKKLTINCILIQCRSDLKISHRTAICFQQVLFVRSSLTYYNHPLPATHSKSSPSFLFVALQSISSYTCFSQRKSVAGNKESFRHSVLLHNTQLQEYITQIKTQINYTKTYNLKPITSKSLASTIHTLSTPSILRLQKLFICIISHTPFLQHPQLLLRPNP